MLYNISKILFPELTKINKMESLPNALPPEVCLYYILNINTVMFCRLQKFFYVFK